MHFNTILLSTALLSTLVAPISAKCGSRKKLHASIVAAASKSLAHADALRSSTISSVLESTTTLRTRTSSPAAVATATTTSVPVKLAKAFGSSSTTTTSSIPIPTTSSAVVKTTTTAAASSSGSASKPGSGLSKKKGLGYNTESLTTAFGDSVGWKYNWAAEEGAASENKNAVYLPMLWGSDGADTFVASAEAAISAGATAVLTFNEPDLSSQSNLSPSQAAQLWKQSVEPLYGKATLVGPGITAGGMNWLSEFFEACDGCHIEAISTHFYGNSVEGFQSYLTSLHEKFNLPVWITEFSGTEVWDASAAGNSVSALTSFYQQTLPWLESTSWVAAYAAFGDFSSSGDASLAVGTNYLFMEEDGSLTSLGQVYSETT